MEAFLKIDAKNPQTWISRNLFQSYCGAGSEKLIRFYDKAVENRNLILFSLNWLAILMLPVWLGYRKQWSSLITLTFLCAAIPFIEGIFDFKIPNAGLTGTIMALGAMANGFLLMNANSYFIKLKNKGMDTEQIRSVLEDRAMPSVPSSIVGVAAFIIIQLISVVIAESIWRLAL
jgi:hypothetical protein